MSQIKTQLLELLEDCTEEELSYIHRAAALSRYIVYDEQQSPDRKPGCLMCYHRKLYSTYPVEPQNRVFTDPNTITHPSQMKTQLCEPLLQHTRKLIGESSIDNLLDKLRTYKELLFLCPLNKDFNEEMIKLIEARLNSLNTI